MLLRYLQKKIFWSLVLSLFIPAQSVFATPPKEIKLNYDKDKNVLIVEITHITRDRTEHYIRKILVYSVGKCKTFLTAENSFPTQQRRYDAPTYLKEPLEEVGTVPASSFNDIKESWDDRREEFSCKNQEEPISFFFVDQATSTGLTVEIPIVLVQGDTVRVKAVCNEAGFKEEATIVP